MAHQEEEKTILIFAEETPSSTNKVPLHDDDFKVLLQDVCGKHEIITSIHGLCYRVEVFVDGVLEDAVEIGCDDLERSPQKEKLFKETYTQAHQSYKDTFCKQADHVEAKEVPAEEKEKKKKVTPAQQELSPDPKPPAIKQGTKQPIVLVASLFGIFILFVFLGSFLICNQTVIEFFVKKEDRIAYYKQTEPFCHTLEDACMQHTKINGKKELFVSPKACKAWCEEKLIHEDQCALFLPYFPKEKGSAPVAEVLEKSKEEPKPSLLLKEEKAKEDVAKEEEPKQEEAKEAYLFLPEGDIVLKPQNYFELFVENHTKSRLNVVLKALTLNESSHEEIVQFRAGVTTLSMGANSKKRFMLFLEQSYYDQFDKGNYSGTLVFLLHFNEGEAQEIKKKFSFKVE